MKIFLVFFCLLPIIGYGQKTQYPAAPPIVAAEEPPSTTWTQNAIKITNQDLRRHAVILDVSRENGTSELIPSVQEVRAVRPKTKSKRVSESPIFKRGYQPKAAKPHPYWRIKNRHLKGLLLKLSNGGKERTPKVWSLPIQK